jgi:hypoxanthine phosphoribosyltransferase
LNSETGIKEVLIKADEIKARVEELAKIISNDYDGKDLVLIGVLKGAVVFLCDLMRGIKIPAQVDFISLSSYGKAKESSGKITIRSDIRTDIRGRDVIIVEDIVDIGLTLQFLIDYFGKQKPASLRVCALLDKTECRQVKVKIDYVGFVVPDKFVVGYGIDYAEKFRNLPFIASV